MPVTLSQERLAIRHDIVIEHMQSENMQDWDRTMATFNHARYELPDGRIFDGADDVRAYWMAGRTQVPDQRNELIELTHIDDDTTQIEFWLRGTPIDTGKPFTRRMWALFSFDGEDRMVNERVYSAPPTMDQIAGRLSTTGEAI